MKKLLLIIANILIIPPVAMYSYYAFSPAKKALDNPPTITTSQTPKVLGATDNQEQIYFTVNIPATFKEDISAPNVVYSVNGDSGEINIDSSLVAGDGISVEGRTISNTGILTLVAGTGISVDGSTITNSGITSLTAGTGISVDGSTITNTYSFTPDYTQSGWTDNGSSVVLTTTTDTVTIGALIATALTTDGITMTNGNSILPDTDLGSDLGSTSLRFNNLWVANINSNSSQSFSGQTTFSYPPTDSTISQASVLINPTTSAASGQLLGLSIAGYQKALIDEDGDIILGYSDATSAPASDYPLNIYGHSGTRVMFVDASGNIKTGNGIYNDSGYLSLSSTYNTLYLRAGAGYGIQLADSSNADVTIASGGGNVYFPGSGIWNSSGNVGIGTTDPGAKLHVQAGELRISDTDDANYTFLGAYNSNNQEVVKIRHIGGHGGIQINNSAGIAKINLSGSSGTASYFNAGNNVGIGTTVPGAKLDIKGAIPLILRDTDYPRTLTFDMATSNTWRIASDINTLQMYAGPVGSEYSVIQADATGDNRIQTYLNETNTVANVLAFYSDSVGTVGNGFGSRIIFKLENNLAARPDAAAIDVLWNDASSGNESSSMAFSTVDSGGALSEAMRIDNAGNVGIGTTSPGYDLEVVGDIYVSNKVTANSALISHDAVSANRYYGYMNADLSLYNNWAGKNLKFYTKQAGGTSNTNQLFLESTGNVGIGTTSPGSYKLNVQGSTFTTGLRIDNNSPYLIIRDANGTTAADAHVSFRDNADTELYRLGGSSADYFKFQSADSRNWAFTTGNVGIGTTAPTSKLHVSGAVTGKALVIFDETGDQDILVASSSGVAKFVVDNSGNVGIGTTSPTEPLTVNVPGAQTKGILFMDNGTTVHGAKILYDESNNILKLGGYLSGVYKEGINIARDTGIVTISTLTTGTVYSNAGVLTNTNPSDISLKNNVLTLEDGTLDKVLGLRPVSFSWKSTGDGALGFIAQDVQDIFPELVGSNSDGTLGLYTTQFIPVLAKAIQEQQLKIDEIALSTASADLSTYATLADTSSLFDIINELKAQLANTITSITGYFDEVFAKKVNTEELCVGVTDDNTCLTKDQVDRLMELLPSPTPEASAIPSPEPTPSPDPSPTPEATSSATLD